MENYKLVNANIYCCSNKYYVIKKNYKLYVYDYEHYLVFESKPIKNIIYGNFVSDDLVYFGMTVKRLIYRLDIKEKKLERIKYTNFSYPDARRIFGIDDKIYIFYNGSESADSPYVSALAVLNKETSQIEDNLILPDNMISWQNLFTIDKKIYLTSIYGKFDDIYYNYYLYEKSDKLKIISEMSTLDYETEIVVSDNEKYLIIASVYSMTHFGEILIYDLSKNCIIDTIMYEHVAEYRTIYHSFHYNNKDYVIFQANPIYCTWKDDLWHTYLYSIQDKKIVAKYSSTFLIRYIQKAKTMIVETANYYKRSEFYTVDDQKENLFEVLEKVHKNVKVKSKKIKNDAYFKECPFQTNKLYNEYSEKEAEEFFQSFIETIDERIDCLFKVMNRLMNISLEYDYETFERVIDWYFSVFNMKFYIPENLNQTIKLTITDSLLYDYQFTDLTYTTMAYVGTYIGKMIQYHDPKSMWKLDIDKNSQNYHQLYIERTNRQKIYPLVYMETISRCLLDRKSFNLKEIFQF